MSKEKLLAEARRRYPIGTTYKCVKDGCQGTSTEECQLYLDKHIYSMYKGNHQYQYVYMNGVWADIVSLPENVIRENYSIY